MPAKPLARASASRTHRSSRAQLLAAGALCGALVYLSVVNEKQWLGRLMSSTPLRALGVVSFSLYLFHYQVRNAFARWGVPLGDELFLLTLGATYLIACVVYTSVERPFMRIWR